MNTRKVQGFGELLGSWRFRGIEGRLPAILVQACVLFGFVGNLQVVVDAEDARHYVSPHPSDG